jgi:DNA gyrase/topoisomerase IV subunit B
MTDTTQTITFGESVRKRPFMYIGNDCVVGLLNGLITDCIELCKTDKITFEITMSGDNDFILGITTQQDLNRFWQSFSSDNSGFNNYFPKVLKVVSSRFEIKTINQIKSEIHFSFDKEVISNTTIDYLKLSEKVLQLALLNRQSEIITIDQRQKYINQNYYHFPQGVFYLFDRAATEVLGKPEFKLTVDNKVDNNSYQIGLAYRTDWFPTPNVISFANDVHTVCGGSLVDGVLDGLVNACKTYVKENNLTTFKVNRKKFVNGLILICPVRGQDFKYGGSWKETLEDDTVRKEVKKLVATLALDFFKTHKDTADKFFWRFDTTQLTSGMY